MSGEYASLDAGSATNHGGIARGLVYLEPMWMIASYEVRFPLAQKPVSKAFRYRHKILKTNDLNWFQNGYCENCGEFTTRYLGPKLGPSPSSRSGRMTPWGGGGATGFSTAAV